MLKERIKKLLIYLRRFVRKIAPPNIGDLSKQSVVKLHLGCGNVILKGWINIDGDETSGADLVVDFKEIDILFERSSIDEILMVHSISYLRLWEAREFFKKVFSILKPGGKFTLEFPDIAKCSKALLKAEMEETQYLEAVRPFYAFDMNQVKKKENYTPYAFGWSSWHLQKELSDIGFLTVNILGPLTHDQLTWRDSRIEAIK